MQGLLSNKYLCRFIQLRPYQSQTITEQMSTLSVYVPVYMHQSVFATDNTQVFLLKRF